MAQPRWTDERTEQLVAFVGDESPVTRETVDSAAEELETSNRSISAKLRKLGYEVETAGATPSKFSEEEADSLRSFVETNSGTYTYAELSEVFADGKFSAKQLQGKILAMQLTQHVRPAPARETTRTFSESEEETFLSLARENSCMEDIAAALDRPINQVRGKALSFVKNGELSSIPVTRDRKGPEEDALANVDVPSLTVAEIAESLGKSERGVKSMLTRRGLVASDYDGAKRKAKREATE